MALAVSKAAQNIPTVAQLQTIVSTIYQHINNSPNRLAKFKNMASVLSLAEDANVQQAEDGEDDVQVPDLLPTYTFLKFKKVNLIYNVHSW